MKELIEDFEILIVAWLKSGDENATNLAHSLAKHAEKALVINGVSNCGGAIPYDSLSDSFKKSIDSIEDNLNR